MEYADNRVHDEGYIWYTHPYSPHEYKGRILGHPMGTDASSFSAQGRWFFLPSTYLELALDLVERYYPGPAKEETTVFRTAFQGWLTPSLRAALRFDAATSKNFSGLAGTREESYGVRLDITWRFSGVYDYLSSKELP
jgi:hypothetical protein